MALQSPAPPRPKGKPLARAQASPAAVFACVVGAALGLACAAPSGPPEVEEGRLDRFNRSSERFNYFLMQEAVKPLAHGYNFLIPKLLQEGITNLVQNLERPRDIVNSLLQARFERAGRHLASLILNTGFGFGGLFYVSHRAVEDVPPETFNETLGVWGLPPGPFLVLPIVVPTIAETSPRKLTGTLVDLLLNPLFWIPGTAGTIASSSATVGGGLNTIASLMPAPFASEAEWAAFEELYSERVPYPELRELFYENQALDVAD